MNESIEKDYMNKLHQSASEFQAGDQFSGIPSGLSITINLPNAGDLLTPREMEVAGLLLQGYTNITIAQKLKISNNTVKTHTRNIYSKMSVANKKELLQLACGKEPV